MDYSFEYIKPYFLRCSKVVEFKQFLQQKKITYFRVHYYEPSDRRNIATFTIPEYQKYSLLLDNSSDALIYPPVET